MTVVFLVVRILIFPYLDWMYARHDSIALLSVPFTIPLKCNLGCLGLISLQLYWWVLMVNGVCRALRKLSAPAPKTREP